MDRELERIADVIASRIQASLSTAQENCVVDCTRCGHCAVRLEGDVHGLIEDGAVRFGSAPGFQQPVAKSIAQLIDHTLLKPDATADEIRQLCDEARKYTFASVCVNSSNVRRAQSLLVGTPVMVCAVVGFPLGAMAADAKAFEAREAVRSGASEIDMVLNIGALKDGDYNLVLNDILRVVKASRPAKVKVILETAMLSDEQKVAACTLAKLAGAHFVKTSTGFGPGGATTEDVELMRKVVGSDLGVKASGGVRTKKDVHNMVAAGANRIGASASVAIVTGAKARSNY